MTSETVITDDTWHRVGLVWDGTDRILYVDDVEIARDTQPGLTNSCRGLYIGADRNCDPATLWSGMIDEVRIYDRILTP